jgi:hypothetical protein
MTQGCGSIGPDESGEIKLPVGLMEGIKTQPTLVESA